MDIRTKTCCIIKRDRLYLKGMDILGHMEWTQYAWDAWRTRHLDTALRLSWKTGGSVHLFNPIVGQVAPLRRAQEQ